MNAEPRLSFRAQEKAMPDNLPPRSLAGSRCPSPRDKIPPD